MPLGKIENKTYLQIGWGRLRKKADVPGEGVVERLTQKGEKSLAYEYPFVLGQIVGLFYKESKDFGNSFELTVDDGHEKFSVSFKEDSRYCTDFLSKLPLIDLSKEVKITPYQMQDRETGKERRGVSIMQGDVKLKDFFSAKENDKRIYQHGFPEPSKSWKEMSETEMKIYFLLVKDFLKKYTFAYIIPKLKDAKYKPEDHELNPALGEVAEKEEGNDDLPF